MATPKVIVVENSSSGKTTTCYKLLNSLKEDANIPSTLGVEIRPYRIQNGNS